MIQRIPITNFQGGVLSRKMAGRYDLSIHSKGAEKLENWWPFPQGGVSKRPGTEFRGQAKSGRCRLIPLVVSQVLSYAIELGNLYIRIWKDGSLISNAGVPVEFVTTYTTAILDEVQFCQVGDNLILVHRAHKPQILVCADGDNFAFGPYPFDGAEWIPNHQYETDVIVYKTGKLYYSLIAGVSGATGPSGTSEEGITDGAVTWRYLQDAPFRQTNEYPGCAAFFAGRLWLGSTNLKPKTLWATKPYEYNNFQLFEVVVYSNRQIIDFQPYNFSGEVRTTNGVLIYTAMSMEGNIIPDQFIYSPMVNGKRVFPLGTKVVAVYSDRVQVNASATYVGEVFLTASSVVDPTVIRYESIIIRNDVIGPGSAIELELAGDQNNRINFIGAGRDLVIGTIADEWVIPREVTAVNVQASLQTRFGSSNVQGRLFQGEFIFIQGDGKRLREYKYNSVAEAYQSPDLAFFADHILSAGVRSWDYVQNPDPCLLVVLLDGTMAGLTYSKQYGSQAWFTINTGNVESVCVIGGTSRDEIFIAVERGGVRYIERLAAQEGPYLDQFMTLTRDVAKTVSGVTVTWSGTTITGLSWLANKTVQVLAGTQLQTVTVSAGGVATIEAVTGNTIVVGVAYTADGKTMQLTTQDRFGLNQGGTKRLVRVVFRVMDSDSFEIVSGATSEVVAAGINFTGDVAALAPSGWDTLGQIGFRQSAPFQTNILALIAEVDG